MEFLSNLGIKQKFILCSLLPVLGMGLAMASGGAAVGGLVAAVLVAAGLFLAWDFGSDIENLLAEGKTLINGLANKDYNVSVTRNVGSDIGQLLFSLSNLAKSLQRQQAEVGGGDVAAAQKLAAIDVADTSIMIADNDMNIVYVNDAVKEMLRNREVELKSKLPSFNVASLIGTNVDSFHVNPAHQRNMIKNLSDSYITDLPIGELVFGLIATPIYNDKKLRIGTVVEWQDKTDAIAEQEKLDVVSRENFAIRNALEVCNVSVMMADADLKINYMNKAVKEMLQEAESQLQTALPNFRTANLMGTCVDDFHANPAHQRGMLEKLTSVYKTDLPIAGFTFGLIATPLFDEAGDRLGTVVEWINKTEALAEQEKQDVISRENFAIRNALDVCNASVMMADAELNIIYMNKAVEEMLQEAESQLQTALPNFRSANLMGTCVDDFHANPAHQRGMLSKLTGVYQTDLPIAGFTFGLIATPLFDDEGERLGTVVEWDNKTERLEAQENERSIAAANMRIKQALDVCNTSVMMADEDLNIIYMNDAVTQMMSDAEKQLQTALPNFRSNQLMGTCVDDFHKNPAHQRGMLKDLKTTYSTDLPLAGFTFGLIATPLYDDEGMRLGTVVEWDNKTERLEAQENERSIAAANLRIKQALDVCNTSVMMADEDLNIIYMNDAVTQMMSDAEKQLQTALPNFRSNQLMGTCVDDFHKNPAHQRGMLKDLKTTYSTDLPLAGFTFGLIATPLYDDAGMRLGTVVEWDNKTERLEAQETERRIAADNLRIKQALDVCNTSVMMADPDLNIIYMNEAVTEMMQGAEKQLQTALPNFNAKGLMGTCVDDFHKNPSHQRGMLKDLKTTYQTDLPLAGFTFGLIATPLYDDAGERLGTVVEWDNKTERLAKAEEEAEIAADNLRIRQALDVCDSPVMLGDNDLNIIYMNNAVTKMMRDKERDIQQAVPNFRSDQLMGICVDDFHKNPQYQRSMLRDLRAAHYVDLELGGSTFGLIATPLNDSSGTRLGTVIEWSDKTEALAKEKEARAIADANARIKQALDVVGTSAMLADPEMNIIYMNNSVTQMMREAQSDIRSDLPNFNADTLMGTNVDMFHKNPAHQRGMITALASEYATEIVVGGRTFALKANPIKSDDGDRLGTVVEWVDRTNEVAIEKEIDNLVEAAANGDFTQDIGEAGKEGFFLRLTQGLNRLVSTANIGINDVVRVLDAISKGDLTEEITADYAGSFAQLKKYCNSTTGKLTDVVGQIRGSAGQISSGANEIAQGNADLSQRTEEQASSLEETASSMEEMTSTVKQSADNAIEANGLAQMAQGKAAQGGEVVSRAVGAMDAINKSSKEIADIIGVIDEIAFQTNLLALNAAVEAARAGEQGRGFAVVAGEVRNLAGRSATAAKEIKDLIRDSEVKVNEGTQLVNESGQTLNEIVEAVQKVSDMIADISTASQEQTEGIGQVNTAIAQMDEMTQQNAALVEEASAAGEAMAEQAKNMTQLLAFFHLDAHQSAEAMPKAVGSSYNSYSAPPPSAPRPASGGGSSEWEEF